jgi:benzodiazapine receptor
MYKRASALKWWQVAIISLLLSAIGGLASGLSSKKEKSLYNRKLQQAAWAPPAWLFGPAWTFNNLFILFALQRIMRSDIPVKKKLLLLQGAIWVIFFSFGYVYFNRKSSILAAIWTIADTSLAATSLVLASRYDKKLAANYLPLLLWTGYASTIAVYQVLNNPDPVFHTPALLD